MPVSRAFLLRLAALLIILVSAGFILSGALPLNIGKGTHAPSLPVNGIGVTLPTDRNRSHFPSQLDITDVTPLGYSTTPPTSGRHWSHWSSCGFHRSTIPDEVIVHNLEHGNIVLSYNLSDPTLIDDLASAFFQVDLTREWGIARPYPRLDRGTIALTAWGVIQRWTIAQAADHTQNIRVFFDAYAGTQGPEFPNGLPCNGPGSTQTVEPGPASRPAGIQPQPSYLHPP